MEEKIGLITETKAFEQLGILALDGSASMITHGETGQRKADEVNIAVQGLIARLKASNRKENFYLSIVTYDHNVDNQRLKPTVVDEIDDMADYNPLNGHGGDTAIGDALEAANDIAEDFLAEQTDFPRSVVIILMTDGQNNFGKDPIEVANKIKDSGKRIFINSAGYGKGEDVDALTLQKIASESGGYIRAYDPEKLRKFFEASVSKIRG